MELKKNLSSGTISAILLLCLAVVGAYAADQLLSNIYQHKITVTEAQLMTISPAVSTPFLNATITGQAFNITVNVDNPNPVALKGRILLTFTKTGITLDSVAVTSTWLTHLVYQLQISKTLEGDTLIFRIYPNYPPDPYFTFQPGSNPAVCWFTVTYAAAGSYDIALAVVAS